MKVVSVNNLSKSYQATRAINDLSFEVEENELFGFIGPDGAGKTTLFRILTTLLVPDSGSASILNLDTVKDFKQIRNLLGYMPGKFSLYQDLSVEENLNFFATIFNTTIEENYHLIKDIYSHIEPFRQRPAGKLSGGMKQKLALSCALIHKPKVLILDEPTTGVDAVSRKEFWLMLKDLQKKGITILVSTPYMDEASMCDRVALIQKGNILSIDSPGNIIRRYRNTLYAIKYSNLYHLRLDLLHFEGCQSAHLFGQEIHFTPNDGYSDADVKQFLVNKGYVDAEMEVIEPGIEDCFMQLMVHQEQQV